MSDTTQVVTPAATAAVRAEDSAAALADLPRSTRYEIVAAVAAGGMGEVLQARDVPLARDVIVKRMRTATPSPESVARFLREARIQGRLEHPAIVPVHELAVDGSGRPFFVMKQLAAETLADVLARGDRAKWTRPRLLRAFVDVCLAIEFAHTRGVVHRDLKPANIAVGDFGDVYVLDWGVARIVGDHAETLDTPPPADVAAPTDPDWQRAAELAQLPNGATVPGSLLGTPGYMAPEQIRCDPALGPASDVYSLGAILFELLAGQPLHPRNGPLASTVMGADARPSARAPDRDVSPELDAICMRATATDPRDRFASARALADAVQRFLDGDRDVARRRELAAEHLAAARRALAAGDSEDNRTQAVRSAGRALALDPGSIDAADLVSHLVLAPPAAMPGDVRAAIDKKDVRVARDHARLAALGVAMFLAFLPLIVANGVRDWTYLAATYAVVLANTLFLVVTSRGPGRPAYPWLSVVGVCVQIGLFSRIFGGPFVLPIGMATAAMAMVVSHPELMKRPLLCGSMFTAAVLLPWGLELVGAVSPTYRVTPAGFLLEPVVLDISPVVGQVTIAAYMVGAIATIGLLSTRLARRHREIRDRLELQAWHFRQLVPAARVARATSTPG